jgi:hypothetical protein
MLMINNHAGRQSSHSVLVSFYEDDIETAAVECRSLDIEGAEFPVLKTIPWDQVSYTQQQFYPR